MDSKSIFISYSWDDKEEVNRIDSHFTRFGINLIRDIRELAYNSSIRDFMKRIGTCDKVILYISENYLKSVNCMYEASQVLEIKEKFVLIVKKGTQLYGPAEKKRFIDYWKEKYSEISKMDEQDFKNEIEDTKIAYNTIAKFIDRLTEDLRMNDEKLDFDELFDNLEIEKKFPSIITKEVYNWIGKYENLNYSTIVNLVYDLLQSTKIRISEYPNIPDNEFYCFFERINFGVNINGININIHAKDKDSGNNIAIIYPSIIRIEENTMGSAIHSKYCLSCENASKKQKYNELINSKKYEELNSEDQDLIVGGYKDDYRIIVLFNSNE